MSDDKETPKNSEIPAEELNEVAGGFYRAPGGEKLKYITYEAPPPHRRLRHLRNKWIALGR